jgi:hypothetical protein
LVNDVEKMENAKTVLTGIAKGVDPLTGEAIKEDIFLNDPRIIRCFYYVTEVLDNVMNSSYGKSSKLPYFIITKDQKDMVRFPDVKIGVNEFSRQINLCIDQNTSKKLTGMEMNRRLRKMGILGEGVNAASVKMRTVTNANSANYGFELEKRTFNGTDYDMVVMDDKGKQYQPGCRIQSRPLCIEALHYR